MTTDLFAHRDKVIAQLRARVAKLEQRAEQAEAALERVQALSERWQHTSDRKGSPLRELRAALDPAQQPPPESPFGERHGPTPEEVDTCVKHAGLLTGIGYPVRCPHCRPDAAPVPSTHWTKHLQRHHLMPPT